MVRKGGFEPPRPFGHWTLNPARLPVPPLPHLVEGRVEPDSITTYARGRQSAPSGTRHGGRASFAHPPTAWYKQTQRGEVMARDQASKPKKDASERRVIATNRKARHDYAVLETYETGIELKGSEV